MSALLLASTSHLRRAQFVMRTTRVRALFPWRVAGFQGRNKMLITFNNYQQLFKSICYYFKVFINFKKCRILGTVTNSL